jgi:transcriptional regulator with XRE-family HTH domain
VEYRAAHGLTQEAFAKLCNVHLNTLRHAEQGKPLLPVTAAKITRILEGRL